MSQSDGTTTAAIYCRISYDKTHEGLGVERQEAECRALAERHGLTVGEVFVDNDISATSGVARPSFDRLLASDPAAIIAWHQDRLLRLTRDLERVIALNVPVYTVTAGTLELSTPSGRAVARTVAAWSQYEGEQKALRQMSANEQAAAKGMPAARVGYGHRRDPGGRVIAIADEVEVMREISRRILGGDSLRGIAADLNERSVPTPKTSTKWEAAAIRQIMLRESAAGLRIHRGKVVGELHPDVPRIFTMDEHERLKAVLRDPARRTTFVGRTPKYLLGGIAVCGRCGGAMVRQIGRTAVHIEKGRRQPASYACAACFRVRRKQESVDEIVEKVLILRLQQPDAIELFARGDDAAASQADAAIESVRARLDNAADAYAAGALDLAQLTRISAQLKPELARLEVARQAALPPAIPSELVGEQAPQTWERLSMDAKRAVVRTLLRVTILPLGPGKRFDPESVRIEWLNEADRS